MRNIKIEIEYDGTNYSGWQMQKNAITIQGEITKALKKLTGKYIIVHGSGRTDKGVHARGQVANFIIDNRIPIEGIPLAINRYVPKDISIIRAREVPMDFHSRYDAIRKGYSYHIHESKHRSPLLRNYSYHVYYELDHNKMREAAKTLVGTHDFQGFMTNRGNDIKSTIRTIYSLDIVKEGNSLWIYMEGDGFLYNMIRIIVGTLVEIGRGKMPVKQINQVLKSKKRIIAGHTAPPQGLFLDKVYYVLTH